MESFKVRVRRGDRLVGTFVKTVSHEPLEVLGRTGLDFVVLDAEHAPFDRHSIDVCVLAGLSCAMPVLVRIAARAPGDIQTALDVGATGVLVPHTRNAAQAAEAARWSRFEGGLRGYSNSPRAGDYGRKGMNEMVAECDSRSTILCQVEDAEALEHISEIASLQEVDCVFIGKADLAMSLGLRDATSPAVEDAVRLICRECVQAGKAVGIFVPDETAIEAYEAAGVTLFVVGSDQSFLRQQATRIAGRFHSTG